MQGLAVEGWVQAQYSITHTALNDPENLEYWSQLILPLVRRQCSLFSSSGGPVNLFTTSSDLVMLSLLYVLMGLTSLERHEKEVVPMLVPYARLRKHGPLHPWTTDVIYGPIS